MLDNLRHFGSSIIGKIMMGFLLVGLAGFGISGVLTSIGSNTVARVGSQEISVRDFQRAYSQQIDAAARQFGSVPTPEEAMAMGIPSSVLNSLAANAALDELGERMGLGASDTRLGQMLRNDPSFAGIDGSFDRTVFSRAIASAGYTESEYLNMLKNGAGRQQIVATTFAEIALPKAAMELLNRYSNDTRTIDYYVLAPESIPAVAEPTEDEMAAYLADNQQAFRTQPTRTARFMVLTNDALARNETVTEEQVQAEYEATKASLSVEETRAIRQVALNDEQKAAFEAGQAAGQSFDDLVAANNLTPTDLGTLARDDITDATLAETAFGLEAGAFALVPGALGTRAVVVDEVNSARVESLEEARANIEQRLKDKQARDKYADVLDGIEELRAAFTPIEEIAQRFNLDISEVSLTESGDELSVIADIPADADAKVAAQVFATEMGDLAPSIAISSNANVWFDLEEITDARDQTLDEVRDQIRTAMVADRTQEALKAAAEEDLAAIKSGKSVDEVAATRNTFTTTSPAFNRNGLQNSPIDTAVASAAFDGPKGLSAIALNGDQNYVIFSVSNVTPATDEPPAEALDYVTTGWRDTIYAEFVAGLRSDTGMSISQNTLAGLVGTSSGN